MQNGKEMIPNRPVQAIPNRAAQAVAHAAETAQTVIERDVKAVKEKAANVKDMTSEKMDEAQARVGKYVTAKPFESIGMAFLGGFVARRLLWPSHKNR
jgi:ElaB/YqjD/DUF883 family membrane-anchored ribosome-binding protein